jgi:hypothetical protein
MSPGASSEDSETKVCVVSQAMSFEVPIAMKVYIVIMKVEAVMLL